MDLYEGMRQQLKEKFNDPTTSYSHNLQILTSSLFTWMRTEEVFEATSHAVRRSSRIKKLCGIFRLPDKKRGKKLSEEIKRKIKDFYEEDDISRICPGKKDFKSMKYKDGSRNQHQKRFLQGNLKEIYQKC